MLTEPAGGAYAQGATVVRYAADARAPAVWTLATQPLLELGADTSGGPTAFGEIMGVVRFRDGRVAVADASVNQVRVFGRNGELLHHMGRSGDGPGEFNLVVWSVRLNGDTILATDNNGRTHLFAANGTVLRSLGRPAPPGAFRPERIGLLSDGTTVVSAFAYPPDTSADEFVVSRVVYHESAPGPTYSRILELPGYARRRSTGGPQPATLYTPAGAVAARGGRICAGYSATYLISCYDGQGRPLFSVVRALTPRTITEEQRQLARDGLLAANRGPRVSPEALRRVEEQAKQLRFAEYAPSFGSLLLSAGGELWVSEFDAAARVIGPRASRSARTPIRWSVYGPGGTWIADISLPARFTPYDVDDETVSGVSLGSDDVERVVVFQVRR